MNFLEFIGFVAMLLLMLNSMREGRRRKENPEEVEAEEEENARRLREFLQGVNSDMEEMKTVPQKRKEAIPLKPVVKKPLVTYAKEFTKPPENNSKEISSTVYHDPYAPPHKDAYAFVTRKKSRAQGLVRRLKSPKDMVLLHEIISPPKTLR